MAKNVGILKLVLAFFFPPVAVFLHRGLSLDLLINIILCCFFYAPGIIHAYWVLLKK